MRKARSGRALKFLLYRKEPICFSTSFRFILSGSMILSVEELKSLRENARARLYSHMLIFN